MSLADNTWSTRYNIPKNDYYSNSSTDCILVKLKIIVLNYGIEVIYEAIDTAQEDMCFSKTTITHSVF